MKSLYAERSLRIKDYGQIYVLIGIFESELRVSIPRVLGVLAITQSDMHWYETLKLSSKGEAALGKAKIKAFRFGGDWQFNRPENFLYLSFWRYLIRREYYSNLWLPTLHQGFPGLRNQKSLATFKELDLRFGKALIARNHVAHYSIHWKYNLEEEVLNLLWLIKAINLELYLSAIELIADTLRHEPSR